MPPSCCSGVENGRINLELIISGNLLLQELEKLQRSCKG